MKIVIVMMIMKLKFFFEFRESSDEEIARFIAVKTAVELSLFM